MLFRSLVWLSTWDSVDDAREFAHGYVSYQTAKAAKAGNLGSPAKPVPDSVWRNLGDSFYVVERRGRDVAVVEGFSAAATAGLLEAAFAAKQTEMKPGEPKREAAQTGAEKVPHL